VHGAKQPITAAITGEYPAGAIGAMRARRETKHHDARIGITETSNGFTPIDVFAVRRTFIARDRLAPPHQPRAGTARLDLPAQFHERVSCRTTSLVHGGRRYETRG